MRTEQFWAPIIGITAVLTLMAVIVIDRYRHPETYRKDKNTEKTKE